MAGRARDGAIAAAATSTPGPRHPRSPDRVMTTACVAISPSSPTSPSSSGVDVPPTRGPARDPAMGGAGGAGPARLRPVDVGVVTAEPFAFDIHDPRRRRRHEAVVGHRPSCCSPRRAIDHPGLGVASPLTTWRSSSWSTDWGNGREPHIPTVAAARWSIPARNRRVLARCRAGIDRRATGIRVAHVNRVSRRRGRRRGRAVTRP